MCQGHEKYDSDLRCKQHWIYAFVIVDTVEVMSALTIRPLAHCNIFN